MPVPNNSANPDSEWNSDRDSHAPTLVITSSASATGRVNRPFTFQVITSGATLAARLSASGLPSGLSADPVTGLISGTVTSPTSPGTPAATLTVTDGNRSATSTLQLTFTADMALPVITSPNTVSITPGVPFSYQIQTDANTTSYFLAFAPSYMQFNPSTGVISGTAPAPFGHDGETQGQPDLSGGIVTNVQLFASGNGGTGTLPLIFFLAPKGVVNIATRLAVGTGEDVLIGGFIIERERTQESSYPCDWTCLDPIRCPQCAGRSCAGPK